MAGWPLSFDLRPPQGLEVTSPTETHSAHPETSSAESTMALPVAAPGGAKMLVMTNRREICGAIDAAAAVYDSCWATLTAMKEGNVTDATMPAIASFQHDLARSLVELDRRYLKIAAERESLIKRKQALKAESFRAHMERLARYQRAIEQALALGKLIGDTFAWFFYQREPQLIEKHLQHPFNLHMPSGVGAMGELAFAGNIKPFNDRHFLIYHGTTTFLRIGDVSFVHLPTRTVSALGELKSKVSATHGRKATVEISLFLIGDSVQLPRRMPFLSKRPRKRQTLSTKSELPPKKEAQLRRQIGRMSKALDAGEPDKRIQMRLPSKVHLLEELVSTANATALSDARIDDGLTAVAFRLASPRSKLSSRLLPRAFTGDIDKLIERSPDIARGIVDSTRNDNRLQMARIYAGFIPGMTPLFWSPMGSKAVKAIAFGEVYCATWFNPVHVVKKLECKGLQVTTDSRGWPTMVTRVAKHGNLSARIVESTIVLITQHLVTEDAFVAIMLSTLEKIEKYGPQNVELRIPILHFYGAMPPPLAKRHRRQRSRSV